MSRMAGGEDQSPDRGGEGGRRPLPNRRPGGLAGQPGSGGGGARGPTPRPGEKAVSTEGVGSVGGLEMPLASLKRATRPLSVAQCRDNSIDSPHSGEGRQLRASELSIRLSA